MARHIKLGNSTKGLAGKQGTDLSIDVTQTQIQGGFVTASAEADAGSTTKERLTKSLESSDDYRLRITKECPVFDVDFCNSSALPNAHIIQSLSTQTIVGLSNGIQLNGGGSIAAGTYSAIRSKNKFSYAGNFSIFTQHLISIDQPNTPMAVSQWGFIDTVVALGSALTFGIVFELQGGGELRAAVYASAPAIAQTASTMKIITVSDLPNRSGTASFNIEEFNDYVIEVTNDVAKFWVNNILAAEINTGKIIPVTSMVSTTGVGVRTYNVNATGAARRVLIGKMALLCDSAQTKEGSHLFTGMGRGSYQAPPGNTAATTVTRTAAQRGWPASGTARATTAWAATNGPLTSDLGGIWSSPAMSTLTSDADYPLFSYRNPAGAVSTPGQTLYITGIRLGDVYVSTAAATNPIFLNYILGVAASSNVTNGIQGGAINSARGLVLGGHGFGATDAVGTMKPGFQVLFNSPLIIRAGDYIQFIVRPYGTVGGNTMVVTGSISFNGYFE